jgi:3-oxoacyl-[acyl-carrier-protein] synthase-3
MTEQIMRNVEILCTGTALPQHLVKSVDIDRKLGLAAGSTERSSGISHRYHSERETATDLAISAIDMALTRGRISIDEIDCLIAASGTMDQAIPYNAAKIHARLGTATPIPAFDVNMTCLSALMALDLSATMIQSGQYRSILVVSSEIASVGIDWEDAETRGLFGDGAAAVVVRPAIEAGMGVIASHFSTYSEGAEFCQIKGGGSTHHPSKVNGDYSGYGVFQMRGRDAFRLTSRVIGGFIDELIARTPYGLDEIDWIVPHQASRLALDHLCNRLEIPDHKIVDILGKRGNQIAASIPSALHELLVSDKLKRGDRLLLVGTSAGLSLGGLVLQV